MKISNKTYTFISVIILIVGSIVAFSIYQKSSVSYTNIDLWNLKYNDNNKAYGHVNDLGDGSVTIVSKNLAVTDGVCGDSIGVTYYRVKTEDINDSNRHKLDELDFIKKVDEYSIYLKKTSVPEFCDEGLKKAQQQFDTDLYKI